MKKYRVITDAGYQEFASKSEAEELGGEVREMEVTAEVKVDEPVSLEILNKILQLETIPRRIRERLAALGDEYAIAEEAAIATERNKLKEGK